MSVLIIVNGQPKRTISTVRSLEITQQLEVLSEQYLGETTNRKDSIYRGVRGRIELHPENDDIFDLQQAVIDKARNRQAGTKVNIKATLQYPNGDRPRVLIPDCEFGEIPLNVGSRSDYVMTTLEFEASESQVIA